MVVTVHLLLLDGEKILMSRRFKTGYEDGNFSVPAGHVEEGESCIAAMIRETKEEIGLIISRENLTLAHVMHRRTAERESVDFFFSCQTWNGKPEIKEPDKCDLLEWYPSRILPKNTIGYIQHAVRSVLQQQKYSEFGF